MAPALLGRSSSRSTGTDPTVPLRWTRDLLQLLEHCEITPYKSSGPGGQKKNKTESAIRARHIPTGIVRIATESRSQSANKLRALDRIREALEARMHTPKPRVPTRPTEGSRKKRLLEKSRLAKAKRRRAPVRDDDAE